MQTVFRLVKVKIPLVPNISLSREKHKSDDIIVRRGRKVEVFKKLRQP